jgi:hypothetical protein
MKRRYIEQRSDAEAKAIDYLTGAKTADEFAGRTLALLLMAVYAGGGRRRTVGAARFTPCRFRRRCRGRTRFPS